MELYEKQNNTIDGDRHSHANSVRFTKVGQLQGWLLQYLARLPGLSGEIVGEQSSINTWPGDLACLAKIWG